MLENEKEQGSTDVSGCIVNPRVPAQIAPLLEQYMNQMETVLPGFMTAFYLHGSIALGAFNERHSDIDFITLIGRTVTETDIECLKEIHRKLASQYPRWPLEGSYLQWGDLGKSGEAVSLHPHYHDGRLEPAARSDANDVTWWVTWWIVKNRGLAVMGPEPHDLNFEVDWDTLIPKMRHNLNTYWAAYINKPRRIAWPFSDYGIQWVVLGVLRQYYSFREQDVTSKTGAGEYALTRLPSRWNRLIREAINIREQANGTLYKSRIVRGVEAFRFLRYIIETCNGNVRP